MKILTTNLRNYKKIFDATKRIGIQLYDSIFLDFSNGYLVFMNETSVVKIQMQLEGEKEGQENFFVDGQKFFFLLNSYDVLKVEGRKFSSPEGNSFVLPTFNEDIELPDFEEQSKWKETELDFTKEFVLNLKTAMDYIEPGETEFSSLFFENDKMLTLSKTKFFQAPFGSANNSFNLPFNFVKILNNMNYSGKGILKYKSKNDAFIIYLKVDNMEILFSTNSANSLPVDPTSEEFREGFFHENWVKIPVKSTLDSIKFLSSLLNDSPSSHVNVTFLEENGKFYIEFTIHNESNILYKSEVESFSDFSYFEDKGFWISLDNIKKALVNFEIRDVPSVVLRYEENAPAVYFADAEELDSDEAESFFIVQTLLEDPTE